MYVSKELFGLVQILRHIQWLVSAWLRLRYDILGSIVVFLATSEHCAKNSSEIHRS